jgi:hypothetical protein
MSIDTVQDLIVPVDRVKRALGLLDNQPANPQMDEQLKVVIRDVSREMEDDCHRLFVPREDTSSTYVVGDVWSAQLLIREVLPNATVTLDGVPLVAGTGFKWVLNEFGTAYRAIECYVSTVRALWSDVGDVLTIVGTHGVGATIPEIVAQEAEVTAVKTWNLRNHMYADGQGGANDLGTIAPLDMEQTRRRARLRREPVRQIRAVGVA